jgi:uncharacterized protein (TIGR02300 family)
LNLVQRASTIAGCRARATSAKAFDSDRSLWQATATLDIQPFKGTTMPKAEWGTKRICPTTGKRFYDLNRSPIISPYTGEVIDIETARRKMAAAVISRVQPEKDDEVLVEDIEADDDLLDADVADDTELDDDLLEDDTDDNVSLDDLADVAGDEEDV